MASVNSAWEIQIKEWVNPQPGQGNPVINLNGQIVISSFPKLRKDNEKTMIIAAIVKKALCRAT